MSNEPQEQQEQQGQQEQGQQVTGDVEKRIADLERQLKESKESKPSSSEPLPSVTGGAREQALEAERMVREAAERVTKERDRDGKIGALETQLAEMKEAAKETVEKAPVKVRRLTKALWGNPDA